jgi:hypothetical protein
MVYIIKQVVSDDFLNDLLHQQNEQQIGQKNELHELCEIHEN